MGDEVNNNALIKRCALQVHLFKKIPHRHEINAINLKDIDTDTTAEVVVYRNHAFELTIPPMKSYCSWWGCNLEVTINGYDDSLSFPNLERSDNKIKILWIDLARYSSKINNKWFEDWFEKRLKELSQSSKFKVIVMICGVTKKIEKISIKIPNIIYINIESLLSPYKISIFDERTSKLTGTRLSDVALLLLSREIACRIIPNVMRHYKKGIILDLDDTLYKGTLTEDGVEGVEILPAHQKLHKTLKNLRRRGIFLSVASKNEESQVKKLFDTRKEMLLSWDDFSCHRINWEPKVHNIRDIARSLNIDPKSLVFVDDNSGELSSVAQNIDNIGIVHANSNAEVTNTTIEFFPGLWRDTELAEDIKRINDVKANSLRDKLQKDLNPSNYIQSLKIEIGVSLDKLDQIKRMEELSHKTNQFNLSNKRLKETELRNFIHSPDHRVITVSLKDKLSDSGIIGLMVIELGKSNIEILELTVSCRALNRGLEDLIIGSSLLAAHKSPEKFKIVADFAETSKNLPAKQWINKHKKGDISKKTTLIWWKKEYEQVKTMVDVKKI